MVLIEAGVHIEGRIIFYFLSSDGQIIAKFDLEGTYGQVAESLSPSPLAMSSVDDLIQWFSYMVPS